MPKIDPRHLEDDEWDDFEQIEKIKPPQKKKKSKGSDFELREEEWPTDGFVGRIVEVHKKYSFVSPEPTRGDIRTREVFLATTARKHLLSQKQERNFVVVGDRVFCRAVQASNTGITTDIPQAVIEHLAPRDKSLSRHDPHNPKIRHTLASNIDQLIVVASYESPPLKWGLIDRYLAIAELQNLAPFVILTKEDLLKDKTAHAHRCRILDSLEIPWVSIVTHAKDSANKKAKKQIAQWLSGKISIFSGHSGVGKSTLVNLFNPELVQVVEPNEDIFYKGRHTTTFASLIRLAVDGYVIDTPGIRSFSIENDDNLALGFREMAPFVGRCRFSKCKHLEEQGCAIIQAVSEGLISDIRYQSYRAIRLGDTGRQGQFDDIDR